MADFRPYSVSTAGLSRVNGFLSTLKLPPIVPGEQILDQNTDDSRFPVPHTDTYAGKYNTVNKTYYTFFDEALRDSQENSLAMGRSGFLYALRRQRQYPSVSLPHDFELDDPEDAEQKHVAADLLNIFKYIKRFNSIKMWLSEAHYFGKSAVQVKIAPHRIAGRVRNTVRAFMPVNGDKLRYHFDGTPGVAIYAGDMDRYKRMFGDDFVGMTTQGPALFLRNAFLRDRFVIHNFEPSDTDYLFESDMAQAVHGIGLRSRLYWDWQILTELLSWHFDALQRVGVNGMLIGLARSGNSRMVAAVTKALIDLQKDNVCVFEIDDLREGMKAEDFIHRIEPAQIGYEVLFEMIKYFANNIREGFLGHGDVSKSNGLNDGTANFYSDTFQYIVTFDATDLEETINDELKPTLLKHNFFEYRGKTYKGDQLPFDLRFKFQIDKKNIKDLMESAQRIFQMGGKLDVEDLRDQAGLKAPKEDANALMLGPHGPGENGESGDADGGGAVPVGNPPAGGLNPEPPDIQARAKTPVAKIAALRADAPTVDRHGAFTDAYAAGELERYDSLSEAPPATEGSEGVMVSISIPPEIAESVAVSGGESPDDMHITLCYLGKLSELGDDRIDMIRDICKSTCEYHDRFAVKLAGVGRFSASESSDDKDVIYLNVDSRWLDDLRSDLFGAMQVAGLPVSDTHGYTPHVTLKYVNKNKSFTMTHFDPLVFTVGDIRLTVGSVAETFPLGPDPESDINRYICEDNGSTHA